ncbi:MAG: hypothetical protein H6718_32035 [Polyangiaceae bacterium]|nr:hypothetical protein [Myxococcales bacterium]MCB9590088.1 hypothetical protein [Polyangiaceae bacterium]MCB9607967.1 hypothetical protein [Polyangiaceae bacterium]
MKSIFEPRLLQGRARRGREVALLLALGVAALVCACGGTGKEPSSAASPGASAKQADAPPLFLGAPADYVPAAGLRWLVLAKPKQLLADARLRKALARLIPQASLDQYMLSSGVDPARVPQAAVAGFDYSTLYIARVAEEDALIEERFAKRLLTSKARKHPHPDLWRTTGMIGTTPQTLVRIDRHLVGVSVGDPTPARVVEAFARRKLKKSPPALEGAALSTLPKEATDAPLVFLAPGPFDGEWIQGAHGLLAHALAAAITLRPLTGRNAGVGRFTLYLAGDWKAVGPDSTARLMDAWDELSTSSTGALFGLDRLTAKPVVSGGDELLKLEIDADLDRLLSGLHAAVAADVGELMQLDPQPVGPPATPGSPRDSIPE